MVRTFVAVRIRQIPVSSCIHLAEFGGHTITTEQKRGVLVLVEPDVSVRDALMVLLRGEGWDVVEAEDCQRLSETIGKGGVAAVVSESSLPDCTPQEILEHATRLGVPVVFTGHDLPLQVAVDLIRQGAMDFLDKPFPQSRLLDLLDRLKSGQNG